MAQQRLDGGEDDGPQILKRTKPLTSTQQRIMATIREKGSIRSVEAGCMVHEARGKRCSNYGAGADRFKGTERAISCCAYASSDGLSAMKRLADRGLVRRGKQAGTWYAT